MVDVVGFDLRGKAGTWLISIETEGGVGEMSLPKFMILGAMKSWLDKPVFIICARRWRQGALAPTARSDLVRAIPEDVRAILKTLVRRLSSRAERKLLARAVIDRELRNHIEDELRSEVERFRMDWLGAEFQGTGIAGHRPMGLPASSCQPCD